MSISSCKVAGSIPYSEIFQQDNSPKSLTSFGGVHFCSKWVPRFKPGEDELGIRLGLTPGPLAWPREQSASVYNYEDIDIKVNFKKFVKRKWDGQTPKC